ncbi:tRNA (guanosine(46)-N7)-methyltransferase TrmB [Evtepia sp.]
MRMRRKKNLIPRMEACADWLIRDPQALRGQWRSLLPGARELRVELGCGKGRFTCETAAGEPEVLFVAVERVPDAMVMAMERARDQGLKNVFFVDADAAGLPDFFAPGEVDRLYINFCDPWPTKRHAKRRLTHRNFLLKYRQVLQEGGEIHFKTDNTGLFAFSLEEFPAGGFQPTQVTDDLHGAGVQGVMTDYEAKFHAMGTPIHRCVAVKGELPPQPAESPAPAEGDKAE